MGDRRIKEIPALGGKERERKLKVHLRRLREVKSSLDTSLPRGFGSNKKNGIVRRKNLKQERMKVDRNHYIEMENKRLMKVISKITLETEFGQYRNTPKHFKSVNGPARKRIQKKIIEENAVNKTRISQILPYYQSKKWLAEREKQEKQILFFCKAQAKNHKGRPIAPLLTKPHIQSRRKGGKQKNEKRRPATVLGSEKVFPSFLFTDLSNDDSDDFNEGVLVQSNCGKFIARIQTPGYIYTSCDSGKTWAQRAKLKSWKCITMTDDGQFLTASTSDDKVWISNDFGFTWAQKQRKISIPEGSDTSWIKLENSNKNSGHLKHYINTDTLRMTLRTPYSLAQPSNQGKLNSNGLQTNILAETSTKVEREEKTEIRGDVTEHVFPHIPKLTLPKA